jgi:pentatricopeptide repeat protein
VLGNALIDMYAKCGMLDRARHVIEDMTVRDVVSWNALIAGFAQHGEGNRALEFFELMRCEGLFPDVITFTCALKACGCIKLIVEGERIHEEIIGMGILNRGMEIGNALIDMYAKCGELNKAREVLEHEIRYRNVVSWNTLITGYVQHCLIEEALDSFCRMQSEGIDPDAITFICILKCCGVTRAVEKGMEIYKEVVCKGLLRGNIVLGNALIDMFAKCNQLEKAHQVLNELHTQNVVSWSTLIIGYTQHGRAEEALNCFEEMQEKDGIPPNEVTLSCVLKACGILGLLAKVKQIHEEIIDERSLFDSDIVLRNALIDVYAKCGALSKAQEVFDALTISDIVSWSSLLAGYAQHGHAEEALHCLHGLQKNGFIPTATIFLSLLSAFSHTGLLEEGITSFGSMSRKYGIVPSIEHYACMVDLLARAGCLLEAMVMVEKLPYLGYLPIWEILMGACQKWGDVDICRVAFGHALELDHRNAEAYVSMANMYAASGM